MATDPSIFSKPANYLIILLILGIGFFPELAGLSMFCLGLYLIFDLMRQKTILALKQPLVQEIIIFTAMVIVSFIANRIAGNLSEYPFYILSFSAYFFGAIYAYSNDRRRIILWSIIIGSAAASCLKLIGHLNLGFNTFVDTINIESDLVTLNIICLCIIVSFFSYSGVWAEKICLLILSLPAFLILIYSDEIILLFLLLFLIIILGFIKSKWLWLFIIMIGIIYILTPVASLEDIFRDLIGGIRAPFITISDNMGLFKGIAFFGAMDSVSARQLNLIEQWPFAFRLIIFNGPWILLALFWVFYTQIRRFIGRLRIPSSTNESPYQFSGFLISLLILTACFYSASFELFPAGVLTCLIWGITES